MITGGRAGGGWSKACGIFSSAPEIHGIDPTTAFKRRGMRRLLPSRSPAWWVVVLISLTAVGVFMAFEVMDLDGSDLYKRIFQPPIPSQPTVAEAEAIMRHGAITVQGALGQLHALVVLQQPFTGFTCCPGAAPGICGKRLTRIRPRVDLHHASFPPPAPADEPARTPAPTI